MDKRTIIINYLKEQGDYVTAKNIALHCDMSLRSVQNYMKSLKADYPDSIVTSQKGVKLVNRSIVFQTSDIPDNYEERKSLILRQLLLNQETSFSRLMDELCVSDATLTMELNRIKKEIGAFQLSIKVKNDKLTISGAERAKKRLLSSLIYDESKDSIVSFHALSSLFPECDVSEIRHIIIESLNKYEYYIDEYALTNLLIHILISISRNNYFSEEEQAETIKYENTHFRDIVELICKQLEDKYQVYFHINEKYMYSVLLASRAYHEKTNSVNVSAQIIQLVDQITNEVQQIYGIDLNVDSFQIGFALHLKNMLLRINSKVDLHNPLLHNIKITAPFIYDVAVFVSKIVLNSFDQATPAVFISEDEIAYLALHIGARIEEIRSSANRIRAVVICPLYYTFTNCKVRKLQEYFEDDLIVCNILTSPNDLTDHKSYDLVISTVRIPDIENLVLISDFLSAEDRIIIQKNVNMVKKQRKNIQYANYIKLLFDEKYFYLNEPFVSKEDVLNKMGNRLLKNGIVPDNYVDKLFEREKISPTNFERIALPHPIDIYSKKTMISVAILPMAVKWNTTKVNMVFMLTINKDDYPYFQNLFTFLSRICMNAEAFLELLRVNSYEEFLNVLIEMYAISET